MKVKLLYLYFQLQAHAEWHYNWLTKTIGPCKWQSPLIRVVVVAVVVVVVVLIDSLISGRYESGRRWKSMISIQAIKLTLSIRSLDQFLNADQQLNQQCFPAINKFPSRLLTAAFLINISPFSCIMITIIHLSIRLCCNVIAWTRWVAVGLANGYNLHCK